MNLKNLKVAVIDDNPVKLKLVKKLIKKYKIKAISYLNGEDFIVDVFANDSVYDAIFVDWQLGENRMDGFDIIHKIKNLDAIKNKKTVIVLYTSYVNELNEYRALNLADFYMLNINEEVVRLALNLANIEKTSKRFLPSVKEEYKQKNTLKIGDKVHWTKIGRKITELVHVVDIKTDIPNKYKGKVMDIPWEIIGVKDVVFKLSNGKSAYSNEITAPFNLTN